MLKKIFKGASITAVALVVLFLMDLSGFNSQGTDNVLGGLDNLGVTFISYHSDETYNIFASLIIIFFVLYLIYTLLFGSKKSSEEM